jgi:putative drug exporter of the RND superfamily
MSRLAAAGVRRPRLVLGVWLAAIAVLSAVGLRVEEQLHRTDLFVPGTAAAHETTLAKRHFGTSYTLMVLLQGNAVELERTGPRIAAAVDRVAGVAVLTPWMRGAGASLRPSPGKAIVFVRVDRNFDRTTKDVVPAIRATLDREVRPPLEAHLTGYADLANGVATASFSALQKAELIAAPLLAIVLLLVFRSAVAAAVPMFLGIATIGAARGVLVLLNKGLFPLDSVALNLASMFGLALGVDYSLLLVSRFREELAAGADPSDAALTAAGTAGRTVKFAGFALGATMVAGYLVMPGNVLRSASVGGMSAVILSVIGSAAALPALLAVLGRRIDRFQLGRRRREGGWGALAWRSVRRPGVAAGIVLGLLLALSLPTLAIAIDPPNPGQLPKSSRERSDSDAVKRSLGAGWSAPYEIVIAARRGPVTGQRQLAEIARWQEELIRDPRVLAVMGPGPIYRRLRPLADASGRIERAGAALAKGRHDVSRLSRGLAKATTGSGRLQRGLADAASAAARLESGAGDAAAAAGALHAAITTARDGAAQLRNGLGQARAPLRRLADGQRQALDGARRLRLGLILAAANVDRGLPPIRALAEGLDSGSRDLGRLRTPVRMADRRLRDGLAALDRMLPTSKADPAYSEAYAHVSAALAAVTGRDPRTGALIAPGYPGLDTALGQASAEGRHAARSVRDLLRQSVRLASGLDRLAAGSRRLEGGIELLEGGTRQLLRGLDALVGGQSFLTSGLGRLAVGGAALASGLDRLRGGVGQLAGGLTSGRRAAAALHRGLTRATGAVTVFRRRTAGIGVSPSGARSLGPAFRSGYFPLAVLDSTAPRTRTGSTFAVNLDRGGSATRVIAIETEVKGKDDPLRRRLDAGAARLARATDAVVAVGGPATTLQDFNSAIFSRLPLLLLTLAAVTFLTLVPVLRSLLVPAVAVALNLLTIGAMLGVLVVLFQGSAPLGGVGKLDAIIVPALISVTFGLAIDYEMFLLARMREGWVLTGDSDRAIQYGLARTAAVITGAALIMTGVFVAFASADIVNLRQYGIGLTVAVALDATIVRLVLLPAVIRLMGERAWWLPTWLDRALPALDVESRRTRAAAERD